jgi:hypothetical protein
MRNYQVVLDDGKKHGALSVYLTVEAENAKQALMEARMVLASNVPRLTEWVYVGLAINLLLAFYSQLNGGGSTWDKFDPILVLAFVFASYVLRRCMRANRWSI